MFTLHNGDCLEYMKTLAPASVDCIVTDPPYGIAFESGWTGSKIIGDESVNARDEILRFLAGVPALVFGSPNIKEPAGTKANLIWHRPGSGMGDLSFPWKPDYEFIHVIGFGFSHKKRGSSVLSFAWDTFRGDAYHPHQKPVSLMKYLIERCPGETIFDPFMGSGSTGVACMQLGRRFIGCEIDQKYFAIAEKRIKQAALQPGLFTPSNNRLQRTGGDSPTLPGLSQPED